MLHYRHCACNRSQRCIHNIRDSHKDYIISLSLSMCVHLLRFSDKNYFAICWFRIRIATKHLLREIIFCFFFLFGFVKINYPLSKSLYSITFAFYHCLFFFKWNAIINYMLYNMSKEKRWKFILFNNSHFSYTFFGLHKILWLNAFGPWAIWLVVIGWG